MSRAATPYEAGDVVATTDGRGVVLATKVENFSFPQSEDNEHADVEVSPELPAYVVALEEGGSAVYREEALETTTFGGTQLPETKDERLTGIVDESVGSEGVLPEGMGRREALEYWASVGSWKACVSDRENELGERTAEAQCTAIKDLLAGTERWREHF
ncbi:hypothetical protein [Halalkalicoccus salilacus]|uniref:hypothetical protein n=1 Tax=Halalkalicoccus salilacus TaxID=3117459 RepID=UPI00300EF3CB